MKKVTKVDGKQAIASMKEVEEKTGVAVKTGLRAGGGPLDPKDPGDRPLYGNPV